MTAHEPHRSEPGSPAPDRREPPRLPNFTRFLVTGSILGFVVGAMAALLTDPAPNYGASAALGYLGAMGAGLGLLVAGVVAVLLDRRR